MLMLLVGDSARIAEAAAAAQKKHTGTSATTRLLACVCKDATSARLVDVEEPTEDAVVACFGDVSNVGPDGSPTQVKSGLSMGKREDQHLSERAAFVALTWSSKQCSSPAKVATMMRGAPSSREGDGEEEDASDARDGRSVDGLPSVCIYVGNYDE